MQEKTNVMRVLDRFKAAYKTYCYAETNAVNGMEVAEVLGQDPNRVYKTLVTVGKSKKYYVFMVQVNAELDLKKAAESVAEKSVEMIKSKELLPLTGYIHGGCSPIGMKKQFKTVLDKSAESFENIVFSAGKIGWQVETAPSELRRIVNFDFADISV